MTIGLNKIKMENENKEKPIFNILGNKSTSESPVKVAFRKNVGKESFNYIKHKILHNVIVLLVPDEEEDYSKINTLFDLINLDLRKPNLIAGFEPPLYKDFVDTFNKSIKTFVKVDDLVTVKAKYEDNRGHIPRQVKDLYLKTLNNMTVIIAILNDNDYCLTNRLEIYKPK
jgi:hypothetical protein